MLIERRGGDTVWKTFHHQRTIGDGGQKDPRNLDVVPKQITLRELKLRPEDLVEVGDAQLVAAGQVQETVVTAGFELSKLIQQLRPRFTVRFARLHGFAAS